METIILFLIASACACAPVCFIRLALPPEPWWLTPVLLLIMGIVIVLIGGVDLLGALAFPPVLAQILSALIIAWGGWVLLALRRG